MVILWRPSTTAGPGEHRRRDSPLRATAPNRGGARRPARARDGRGDPGVRACTGRRAGPPLSDAPRPPRRPRLGQPLVRRQLPTGFLQPPLLPAGRARRESHARPALGRTVRDVVLRDLSPALGRGRTVARAARRACFRRLQHSPGCTPTRSDSPASSARCTRCSVERQPSSHSWPCRRLGLARSRSSSCCSSSLPRSPTGPACRDGPSSSPRSRSDSQQRRRRCSSSFPPTASTRSTSQTSAPIDHVRHVGRKREQRPNLGGGVPQPHRRDISRDDVDRAVAALRHRSAEKRLGSLALQARRGGGERHGSRGASAEHRRSALAR
jgi:hypothetical protein